jgi:hypothetical protein
MDDGQRQLQVMILLTKGNGGGRVYSPAAAAAAPTASVMESEVLDGINGHGSRGTVESLSTPAAAVTVQIELG